MVPLGVDVSKSSGMKTIRNEDGRKTLMFDICLGKLYESQNKQARTKPDTYVCVLA